MGNMEDINVLMARAQAEAARKAAIRRAEERDRDEGASDGADIDLPSGTGVLTVEKRQGRWRCYLAGERIRSGDQLDVYLDAQLGWVRGRLHWGRSPHTPPSVRRQIVHPTATGRDDEPMNLGEVELQLPEDAVCRWPPEATSSDKR